MVDKIEYPALQNAIGARSATYQSQYLFLVVGEYFLLLVASVLALDFTITPTYFLIYALIFLAALVVMLVRSMRQPEQNWYKARAATESIKTSAWRYMMKAHPYEEARDIATPNAKFREYIKSIIKTNNIMKDAIDGDDSRGQVTASMRGVRCLPFDSRKALYLEDRIADQRLWYLKKAKSNRKAFRGWVATSMALYGAAIIMALSRIERPDIKYLPIEPTILAASFVLGWLQIKKHSELAAAYTLTAVEIGLAKEALEEIGTESEFSDFVNDTELVFSREHTQWVARKQTSG